MPIVVHDKDAIADLLKRIRQGAKKNPPEICPVCNLSPLPHREFLRYVARLANVSLCELCHYPVSSALDLTGGRWDETRRPYYPPERTPYVVRVEGR